MFGINDNNQNGKPEVSGHSYMDQSQPSNGALPPSPFMEPPSGGSLAPDPAPPPADEPKPLPAPAPAGPPNNDALISIKEQALSSLSPLVGHLDQSPEEKFKTLMMLIQASDNSGLIKEAYEAANKIPDEKQKAQALLDVVNEINYFTQQKNKKS